MNEHILEKWPSLVPFFLGAEIDLSGNFQANVDNSNILVNAGTNILLM